MEPSSSRHRCKPKKRRTMLGHSEVLLELVGAKVGCQTVCPSSSEKRDWLFKTSVLKCSEKNISHMNFGDIVILCDVLMTFWLICLAGGLCDFPRSCWRTSVVTVVP